MKQLLFAAFPFLLSFPVAGLANSSCSVKSGEDRVPLVELYTSEGCSSCPPADRWLSTLVGRSDINLLAFHVDYWDYIGWPDRFALPANSTRQRGRVTAAGETTVYTPQVMVGEQTRVSWNSSSMFEAALNDARGSSELRLELALLEGEGRLEASLTTSGSNRSADGVQVWLARAVDGQSTRVAAGENRGEVLKHDGIVRQLWGPWSLPVRQSVELDELSASESSWNLVAFAQDAAGRTLQSLTLQADRCLDQLR